jgi:hypothetical protein
MRSKVGEYGIIFNLALGYHGDGNRHAREPDFGSYPGRQERRGHPRSRINVCTDVRFDLFPRDYSRDPFPAFGSRQCARMNLIGTRATNRVTGSKEPENEG